MIFCNKYLNKFSYEKNKLNFPFLSFADVSFFARFVSLFRQSKPYRHQRQLNVLCSIYKVYLINLNGDFVKTFDTEKTRYIFERGPRIQVHYGNPKENPKYPMRELWEVKKDNLTWYYNLETLTCRY
jgi:hypothetical protein